MGGDMFSINSGMTKWTKTSKARINLHGEPMVNRLRARRSALGARRNVCFMSRPPWRICLFIIEGSVLYVCQNLLDLRRHLFLNLWSRVMINFL